MISVLYDVLQFDEMPGKWYNPIINEEGRYAAMYLHCTTEEATRRQRQFAQMLLENMHMQPYTEITIGHLCKAAGTSRTAFYRYFECKDDVLDLLIDDALRNYYSGQFIQINDPESYREGILHFLQYWFSQKLLLDALQKNGLESKLLERCRNHNIRYHIHASHDDLLKNEDNRAQIIMFAVNGLFSLILDWHHNGYSQNIDQMADTVERVMFKPLISI